jgi:hypothetical protein
LGGVSPKQEIHHKNFWSSVATLTLGLLLSASGLGFRTEALSLLKRAIAFSSEVDIGSREENASKQKIRASVLIQSEPKRL